MFLIFSVAFVCELIDSGLGMMYGTLLTPILIIMGYKPTAVIPIILITQALGGVVASIGHHKYKNADFNVKSGDFKASLLIISLGIVSVIAGTFVGNILPKQILRTYISCLVVFVGLIVVLKGRFKFSWAKVTALSMISSFNKAMSGGGYGPLMTNGLVASGKKGKESIAITDFSEILICISAFICWLIMGKGHLEIGLLMPISIGAVLGALCGPYALSKLKSDRLITLIVGYMAVILGVWCLFNNSVKL